VKDEKNPTSNISIFIMNNTNRPQSIRLDHYINLLFGMYIPGFFSENTGICSDISGG